MHHSTRRFFFLFMILLLGLGLSACDNQGDDDDAANGGTDDDNNDNDDTPDDDDNDNNDNDDNDNDDNNDASPTPDPLRIVFEFPPVAASGEEYDYQFQAEGGEPPYRNWQVTNGELPAGLTLSADTGELSGTVLNEEKLYYFVIDVEDSAAEPGVARESFGIRVGDPTQPGPLLLKARHYQEVYNLRHNSDGLTVTADNPDDAGGDYWYSDLGDACFIHGNSSAGAAFWYAVEQSEESLANARLHTRGLDLLNRVNGIPGLMSRSYAPQDAPFAPGEFEDFSPESENHVGEGEFADYYWKGDVSIDQYSGSLVGFSLLYDLVPDEENRATLRRNIVEIADYLWDGGLVIYDVDGEPTTYGDFRGYSLEGWPVPNGLGAAACLAWFKLAHHVSGEARFLEDYTELKDNRSYDLVVSYALVLYLGYQTKHYNVYMGYENMYTLTRLEEDPGQREFWADAFARQLWTSGERLAWRRGDVEANPTFTTWYLYSTGRRDPDAVMKSIWEMDVFVDAPLRDRYIQNSINPDIEKNPEKPDQALYPLPANLRVPDMCIWHRSPYGLDGGDDGGRERSGHDYLLPYWMGRYYGFISPDW